MWSHAAEAIRSKPFIWVLLKHNDLLVSANLSRISDQRIQTVFDICCRLHSSYNQHITSLTDVLLAHVFTFTEKSDWFPMSLTCKFWKKQLYSRTFLNGFNFFLHQWKFDLNQNKSYARRFFPFTQSITLSVGTSIDSLFEQGFTFARLRTLVLQNDDKSVHIYVEQCRCLRITELNLEFTHIFNLAEMPETLRATFSLLKDHYPDLVRLSFKTSLAEVWDDAGLRVQDLGTCLYSSRYWKKHDVYPHMCVCVYMYIYRREINSFDDRRCGDRQRSPFFQLGANASLHITDLEFVSTTGCSIVVTQLACLGVFYFQGTLHVQHG